MPDTVVRFGSRFVRVDNEDVARHIAAKFARVEMELAQTRVALEREMDDNDRLRARLAELQAEREAQSA